MKHGYFLSLLLITSSILSFSANAEIHEHGYWSGESAVKEHITDYPLADALADFFQSEQAHTIVDLGCGTGNYVKVLRLHALEADGYDGNPDTEKLSGGIAKVADLSQSLDLGKCYDWVLCLEVGEHLPQQYEKILINNIDSHNSEGVVLSWAVKGQGGYGHFNEQNNDYVKYLMASKGYVNDIAAENALRARATLWWFKNTIMVFRKS